MPYFEADFKEYFAGILIGLAREKDEEIYYYKQKMRWQNTLCVTKQTLHGDEFEFNAQRYDKVTNTGKETLVITMYVMHSPFSCYIYDIYVIWTKIFRWWKKDVQ